MADDLDQRAEWKIRLVHTIIAREFDNETLVQMVEAGLSQAHSEGLEDAAYVCEKVAAHIGDKSNGKMAAFLARQIHKLDQLNHAPFGGDRTDPASLSALS